MALIVIDPFCYENYLGVLGNTVQEIVEIFEDEYADGWIGALEKYNYAGMNHIDGENIRKEFHEKITSARNMREIIDTSNEILGWGGMEKLSKEMEDCLERSLGELEKDIIDINNVCATRIASISKIYEMWNPEKWIIYDSYCVKGLQYIVDVYWAKCGKDKHEGLLRYPWPAGRKGGPVKGFPRLSATETRQAKLGFIYGSWLCRAIAKILDQKGERKWSAYHVEMAAFQVGHEI